MARTPKFSALLTSYPNVNAYERALQAVSCIFADHYCSRCTEVQYVEYNLAQIVLKMVPLSTADFVQCLRKQDCRDCSTTR